jgi:hypothetical protein
MYAIQYNTMPMSREYISKNYFLLQSTRPSRNSLCPTKM